MHHGALLAELRYTWLVIDLGRLRLYQAPLVSRLTVAQMTLMHLMHVHLFTHWRTATPLPFTALQACQPRTITITAINNTYVRPYSEAPVVARPYEWCWDGGYV